MEQNIEAIFFAQDLMQFTMLCCAQKPWDPPNITARNSKGITPFKASIGDCVTKIIYDNWGDITDCSSEINNIGMDLRYTFGHLALQAAPRYFSKGYSPGIFLGYCALIYGTSLHYSLNFDDDGVAEGASDVIALVLTAFMLTREFHAKGGFEELLKVATAFNKNS